MLDFFKGTVTSRDWAFVGAVLCATAVAWLAFYFLVQRPHEEDLAALQQQIQDRSQELRAAQAKQQNIEDLRQEAAAMEQLVENFQQRLPEERQIPALLSRFEGLGNEIGLRLQLTKLPEQTDRQNNKQTIPYQVTAEGTFHQIVSFVNLLERDERYLKISDIDIREQEGGVSEATFTLSTFRFLSDEREESA